MKKIFSILTMLIIAGTIYAQDYVSPVSPAITGRSPGMKAKLISKKGRVKTYVLVFAPGDEVLSGLNEFAGRNHIASAHFTAIGDATSAKFGWYDKAKKMFKVTALDQPAEITALIGAIAMYNGKPTVHAHISLATEDGMVHGGHLLEAFIAPTLEVMLTVERKPLYKKLNDEYGAAVIDPEMK